MSSTVSSSSLTQYCPHTLLCRHLLIHFCRSYISNCFAVTSGFIFSSFFCSVHCLLVTDYGRESTSFQNHSMFILRQTCPLTEVQLNTVNTWYFLCCRLVLMFLAPGGQKMSNAYFCHVAVKRRINLQRLHLERHTSLSRFQD